MSLNIYMYECECDRKGCEATLIKSSAEEIHKAGWQVLKRDSDFTDREGWIEIGDRTYCPEHHVESSWVVIPPTPDKLEAAVELEEPK